MQNEETPNPIIVGVEEVELDSIDQFVHMIATTLDAPSMLMSFIHEVHRYQAIVNHIIVAHEGKIENVGTEELDRIVEGLNNTTKVAHAVHARMQVFAEQARAAGR